MASEAVLPDVFWRFTAGGVADDLWVVTHVHLREAMSSLFACTVVVATEDEVAVETFLGQTAKLDLLRGGSRRSVQGVVRRVQALGELASHRFVLLEVVPALWMLSQRSDVRIFQDMNAIRVIEEVLKRAGVYPGARLAVDASLRALPAREYCVQYNETDLDFVRRLLEHEGVPFYFRHDDEGGETLVLAGSEHAYAPVATLDGAALRVADDGSGTDAVETVRWFDERHEVRSSGVTLRDFDFTRPRAALDMTAASPGDVGRLARYEYPAPATLHGYDRGARRFTAHDSPRLAKLRAEELATRAHLGEGSGNVTGVTPGLRFDLAGHARSELDRAYLVAEAEHVGQAWSVLPESLRESKRVRAMLLDAGLSAADGFDDRYHNRFVTHRLKQPAASVPFRPARVTARPVVEGPQTARVVGPAGEDIHTDEHGRIKVQLHWDREGREDERSSCWIRCAQAWSGGQWGFVFIPRIGMEVVVQFIEGDVGDPEAAARAVAGVDAVFHEAAIPSVARSVVDPVASDRANVGGTVTLLQAARVAGVRKFVYAASSSAYGDTEVLPKVETMTPRPMSPYAVSKLTGEHYVTVFGRLFGIETVSLRYFNVFGPRQDPASEYAAVIPRFITRMLRGERPRVNGDGEQSRDFCYIDNVVSANLLAARAKTAGEVVNVACGARVTLNALVAMINRELGTDLSPEYGPGRAGDVRHSLADISAARALLGYEVGHDLSAGLKLAIAYYRGLEAT